MRISDWSSDVCSSDLLGQLGQQPERGLGGLPAREQIPAPPRLGDELEDPEVGQRLPGRPAALLEDAEAPDRKSVVKGTSVSVRVDLGGRRISKKKLDNLPLQLSSAICVKLTKT